MTYTCIFRTEQNPRQGGEVFSGIEHDHEAVEGLVPGINPNRRVPEKLFRKVALPDGMAKTAPWTEDFPSVRL